MAYADLPYETADVAGKEQLSFALRFYDEKQETIWEEFASFIELRAQNASSIAEAIDNFLDTINFLPDYCVGLGFDDCSTMAGKEVSVQRSVLLFRTFRILEVSRMNSAKSTVRPAQD